MVEGEPRGVVLVIDGGGRGDALVQQHALSSDVVAVHAIPGNDYMQQNSQKPVITHPGISTTDIDAIVNLAQEEVEQGRIPLVDIAQDNAVAAGLKDALTEAGIQANGPTREAGRLEWDKADTKLLLARLGVRVAQFAIFESPEAGEQFIRQHRDQAWFVKASGLAGGKAALPAFNNNHAIQRIAELQKFGDAGEKFLLEEWLRNDDGTPGEEFSAFAIFDGLGGSQMVGYAEDSKRALDGDKGENTGGMGAFSHPSIVDGEIDEQVQEIFTLVSHALQDEGRPFQGTLYLGGMVIIVNGEEVAFTIEFNARPGDPETQVLFPGINNYHDLTLAAVHGQLSGFHIDSDGKRRVVVAATAEGYPGDYSTVKGRQISGLEKAAELPGVTVFGAGIKRQNGLWVVNGGRVAYLMGEADDIEGARRRVYEGMKFVNIDGDKLHYRTDIAKREEEREKQGRVIFERPPLQTDI